VERQRSIELGRSLLEKEARRYNLGGKHVNDEQQKAALAALKLESLEDLHAALGRGKVTPHQYLSLLLPDRELKEEAAASLFHRATRLFARKGEKVLVRGMGDALIKLARCCNPIPGDHIIGYITRGKGVSVHTEECPNLDALLVEQDRRIEVEWAPDQESSSFTVGLWVVTENRAGMLARVAEVLEREKINIRHADAGLDEQQRGAISLVAEVGTREQVDRLVDRIRRIDGVYQVQRISPTRAAGQGR
jgi:GTP pyrophosphokinase